MIHSYPFGPHFPLNPTTSKPRHNEPCRVKITSNTGDGGTQIEQFSKEVVQRCRTLPLESIKRVYFLDTASLQAKLKPGDIFLSYCPENEDMVTAAIRTGQAAEKLYTKTSTDQSQNFVHAALYVGDSKCAEAVKDGIRINTLEGERFRLKTGEMRGFLVIRPRNQEMAKEASRIAKEVATEDSTAVPTYKYNIARALFSGVMSSELNEEGIKRYLKGACYAYNRTLPYDRNGIRDFFCSYFVGWACQAGESIEVMKKVNESLPEGEKIVFPDITRVPAAKKGEVLESWAREVTARYYHILKEVIKLDFDPKWTSPQRFYGFVLEHPELFSQELMIVAPQAEIEMEEFSPEP